MSWFDSSFSFARTALSQAQRSIDKALDIHEEQGKPQELSSPGVCMIELLYPDMTCMLIVRNKIVPM